MNPSQQTPHPTNGAGGLGGTGVAALVGLVFLGVLHSASYVHAVSDDAFISLRYAANLAGGHGLVYNPGETPVEGISNPLFTWMAALLLRFGLPPLIAVRLIGILGLVAILLLLPKLVGLLDPRSTPLARVGATALYAASAYAAFAAMTGLETSLHAACILAATILSLVEVRAGRVRLGPLAWLAVACSRPEGVLLAAAAAATQWACLGCDRRVVLRWAGLFALPAVVLLAARFAYYGAIVPNTFHVKVAAGAAATASGWSYLVRYLHDGGAIVAVPAVVALALARPSKAGPRIAALPLAVIAAQLVYLLYVGRDVMPGARFLMPIHPLLCAGAALALIASTQRLAPAAGRIAFASIGVVACASLAVLQADALAAHPLRFWLVRDEPRAALIVRSDLRGTWLAGHQAAGEYLREHARPGDWLATTEAGVMPFHSKLPTLDLLGLNDREIARARGRAGATPMQRLEADAAQLFALGPRWIVLDGAYSGDPEVFRPRLILARIIAKDPAFARYRPVFRSVVYRGERAGMSSDRINVVFERAASRSGAVEEPAGRGQQDIRREGLLEDLRVLGRADVADGAVPRVAGHEDHLRSGSELQ